MPYKYVPVTSFDQAKAADRAGLLWIANYGKEERVLHNNGDPDWRNSQESFGGGYWEARFAKAWDMEDFAVLIEYDEDAGE